MYNAWTTLFICIFLWGGLITGHCIEKMMQLLGGILQHCFSYAKERLLALTDNTKLITAVLLITIFLLIENFQDNLGWMNDENTT